MTRRKSRLAILAAVTLSENRLLPTWAMRRRGKTRVRFLRSLGIKGGVGAEIGVHKGLFSHVILHVLRPDTLHLIDPWHLQGETWDWTSCNQSTRKALANVRHWFRRDIASGRVVLHVGFDEAVLAELPDRFFDWVYLDTTHTHDQTKRELELLHNKVKSEGVILGDDWFTDPDHRFYEQCVAIREFVQERGYTVMHASGVDHQWAICCRDHGGPHTREPSRATI